MGNVAKPLQLRQTGKLIFDLNSSLVRGQGAMSVLGT